MTTPLTFDVQVDQNKYMPAQADVMDAVIGVSTARATGSGGSDSAPTAAQVIMVDTSGSMGGPKITEARRATVAAIDALREGVAFAVVSGRHKATMVYPEDRALVPASAASRDEATAAVAQLEAGGGTAIGTWLDLARTLLAASPAAIRHAILLTDGHNEHQEPRQLAQAVDRCRGVFTCDSRGVGTGWGAEPLMTVAEGLLGTAAGLKEPAELAADFQAMTEAVMGKLVGDVVLRLWMPSGATLRFLRQVYPTIVELSSPHPPEVRVRDFPTGSWGAKEFKHYHLSVTVPAGELREEMLCARVSVLVDGEPVPPELKVLAQWTDDLALSTQIHPQVAHYTGQQNLAAVMQDALAARDAGQMDLAAEKFGEAVVLADRSGNEQTLRQLERVVEVIDRASGTVRHRPKVEDVDAEMARVQSVRTVRSKRN